MICVEGNIIEEVPYMHRPMSIEQENILAKMAAAPRLTQKHWRLLYGSGLTNHGSNWFTSEAAKVYIQTITLVHGPTMTKMHAATWYDILRWGAEIRLLEKFWKWHDSDSLDILRELRKRRATL